MGFIAFAPVGKVQTPVISIVPLVLTSTRFAIRQRFVGGAGVVHDSLCLSLAGPVLIPNDGS